MWKACRPKSNRLAETGCPSTRRCFSGRCQPQGRTRRVATRSWRRYTRPSSCSREMVRSMASVRLSCPSRRFSQVGRESSKSAMKALAPELKALIIILRSTGPVISTRRSAEVCRHRGHAPVPLPYGARLGQEVRAHPGVQLPLALRPALQERARRPPNSRCRRATKARASALRTPAQQASTGPRTSTPSPVATPAMVCPPPAGAYLRVRGPRRSTVRSLYCAPSRRGLAGEPIVFPWEAPVTTDTLTWIAPARRRDHPPGGGAGLRALRAAGVRALINLDHRPLPFDLLSRHGSRRSRSRCPAPPRRLRRRSPGR